MKARRNTINIASFNVKNSSVKFALLFFLVAFLPAFFKAQIVHHQMVSSQGASVQLSNNLMVQQSIGQQSVTGNYLGSAFSVGQGFQQGRIWKRKGPSALNIQVMTFPNPFSSKLNFQFSAAIDGPIKINIYDVMGKLVMTTEKEMLGNTIVLENLEFPNGQYVVKFSTKNFNYSTQILKM